MLDFSEKLKILNKTELDEVDQAFDVGALRVLAARYLLKDENGIIVESPKEMFERIAILVAISDILHDERVFDINGVNREPGVNHSPGSLHIGQYELNKYHIDALIRLYHELDSGARMKVRIGVIFDMIKAGEFESYEAHIKEYYDLMVSKDFLPNTPTLMNAGAPLGQLSACFVLDIQDDMAQIMDTAKDVAMIFKSGGGVGINYSKLRPEGDMVSSTSGVASGPISFMKVIDAVTGVVKQGGKRRGANMGIMDFNHPDVDKFIDAKLTPGVLENFNVSVGTDDTFWRAVKEDSFYELKNPRTGEVQGGRKARFMLDKIAANAHASAEPGLIFFDNINAHNPVLKQKGALNSTNPCGEQALYPYESCNLGSINLSNFVEDGLFNWVRYECVIRAATRFLDNIIDVNKYPLERINEETKKTRRIGLGIMGLADCLFKMNLAYNSAEGYDFMNSCAERLSFESMMASAKLASERGSYPLYDKEEFMDNFPVAGAPPTEYTWNYLKDAIAVHGIRNAWTTTIAPTGTLSMLAGCSSGVEPVFGLSFEKHVTVGKFDYINENFLNKLNSPEVDQDIVGPFIRDNLATNHGSCKGIDGIPEDIQRVFVTAMDISWADHIYAEAVWQKWISNAIAKTINLPAEATVNDVRRAYLIAHELGLKGITVYRDGSRLTQVLHVAGDKAHSTAQPSEAVKSALLNLSDNEYIKQQIEYVFAEPHYAVSLNMAGGMTVGSMTMAGGMVRTAVNGSVDTWEFPQDGCPCCGAQIIKSEGCVSCKSCGWSACSSG